MCCNRKGQTSRKWSKYDMIACVTGYEDQNNGCEFVCGILPCADLKPSTVCQILFETEKVNLKNLQVEY